MGYREETLAQAHAIEAHFIDKGGTKADAANQRFSLLGALLEARASALPPSSSERDAIEADMVALTDAQFYVSMNDGDMHSRDTYQDYPKANPAAVLDVLGSYDFMPKADAAKLRNHFIQAVSKAAGKKLTAEQVGKITNIVLNFNVK